MKTLRKTYVGYVHAIAHSLGGEYNVPHGLANAVILPMMLEAYGRQFIKSWLIWPLLPVLQRKILPGRKLPGGLSRPLKT